MGDPKALTVHLWDELGGQPLVHRDRETVGRNLTSSNYTFEELRTTTSAIAVVGFVAVVHVVDEVPNRILQS